MKVKFWGAAKEVTGSKHILEVNGSHYLLDCGMFQGHRTTDLDQKNRAFLLPPSDINAIILSHAHIDHSGLLPYFVSNGFGGHIYATPATQDLCSHMLLDSAHIQEMDHLYAQKHHLTEEGDYSFPLYTTNDIPPVVERFISYNYNHEHKIDENLSLTFMDAGHVLGSGIVVLTVREGGKEKRLVFSGDLGRKGLPILRDPTYVSQADYVILESTYGDRVHDPVSSMQDDVEKAVNDSYQRGGKIIVPAFSLERTQEMIYLLHLLEDEHRIPDIPIFVDSPLSFNLTQVYQMHPESYDLETYQAFLMHQDNPFGFGKLKFVRSTEESKQLNYYNGSCIIISASGMCEAGRIRHHIANNIEDDRAMILIIGYQAEGTLGKKLVEKDPHIRIFGVDHPVKAEVRVLNSFSSHADKNDLLDWISHVQGVQKVFLVHGEEVQMNPFKEHIVQECPSSEVNIPSIGEEYEL